MEDESSRSSTPSQDSFLAFTFSSPLGPGRSQPSPVTTAGTFSRAPREPRRKVDGAFVQFLIDYAANDTECPPLFKAYLEEVVLRPGIDDLALKTEYVEYHLRNPDIKKYNLGSAFLRELERYTIYDNLYPESGPEGALPSAPIPEHYQPRVYIWPGQAIDPGPVVDSVAIEDLEPVLSEEEDEGYGGRGLEPREREGTGGALNLPRPLGERRPPHRAPSAPSAASRRSRSAAGAARAAQGAGEGTLSALLRRLQSIDALPRTEDPNGRDDMMNRTGPDWEVDSWYKDRRQPPLAVRLDTIVKFLAEEDVDRCMHWETKLAEIVSYLEWLAHDDDRHQLQDASAQTRAMFNDAVLKAKAHVLFERHHYEPTPLEITRPPSAPLRSTRLNWMTDTHGWPLPGRNPVPDRSDLLPRPIPPRPSSPVNRMLIDKPDGGASFDKFVADEKEWWQRVPGGDDDADHDNLAYIEAKSFDSFVHGDNIGWIVTDPATGQTALPDGTSLLPGSPRSWALERGARRAGLQQMLRALPTGQPPELDTPWRRLVLPTPASTIRAACERADGPQWTPPRLSADQLPAELETMAHTVAYRARLAQIKRMRELARLRVEDEGARDRRWVTLPRNVVNGGPFVWRMLDPDAQAGQDLLRQCRVVMEVLRAALRRVPRPLLEAVVGLAERAASGQFWEEGVPAGLRLADDEWDQVGRGRLPRLLDAEEVEWLKFLAGECVNSKNWTGRFVPDTPRDKYRLFLIFAARVQKLLHDKNPEGLFSRHDAQVTVEELLQAVNAGTGNSAVTKCEFHPFDACSWLDRMKESGHVRFHLDPTCYGVVQRPRVEYFPEHRVVWPTEADNRERPSHLGYIADWSSIVPAGHKPDVSESSAIGNFFRSLAFRLGYTIFALEQAHSSQTSPIQPVPTQHLRSSISKWAHACATMEGADAEPSREELALIRSHIIAEASANETMLAPGRVHHFFDAEGNPQTTLVRDHNWDWASLPTTSTTTTTTTTTNRQRRPRRQFWSVDRWPLGTGYLSDATERAIADDEHLDPRMTHDPFASDPTDRRYMRPKLQPYREEKVLFRPGPAVYPVGDTRLQRETLEARMTDMVAQAIGLDTNQHTWGDTLARLNPFSRPSSRAEDRRDGGKLPPVNPKAVPKSWDPREETEKLQPEEALTGEEEEADEGEAEDETPSVDVAMTGVGESWMAATGLT